MVCNFVKSDIAAVLRLKTGRALGLTTAAKYLRLKVLEDKELLQPAGESSIDEKKLPAKQYLNAGGIETILDELAVKEA